MILPIFVTQWFSDIYLHYSWWDQIDPTIIYITIISEYIHQSWWEQIDPTVIYIAIVLSYMFIYIGWIKFILSALVFLF